MKKIKKKKKLNKKKKFFLIVFCYIATFVMTAFITVSTLSWFNSSTWQSNILYMGGPVYIHFSDDTGVNKTSGTGKLVIETPPGWTYLYPGMNINFEARAVVEGAEFTKDKFNGEQAVYTTTGAVLRAKVTLDVRDTNGSNTSIEATDIYSWIWPQLHQGAITDTQNNGMWVFDQLNNENLETNYFYYVQKGQGTLETGNYLLEEVGGVPFNVTVGFLNNIVVQMPPIELTNAHADCTLKFTIVFEALQAFFPYDKDDLGQPYQGNTTGRSDKVEISDLGLEKPLTIGNGRDMFNESMFTPENGYPEDPDYRPQT